MEHGLSKGVKLVTSMSQLNITGSTDSFEKLVLKHPSAGPSNLSIAQCAQMASFHNSVNSDNQVIEATDDILEKVIRELSNGTSHGADHLRAEHLKQLYNFYDNTSSNVTDFRECFKNIITAIINGRVPIDVQHFFRDFELIAIPKNLHDVRPIGLQNIF